jgi:flavin reductase (DIM6/NTAB) family NADH-FMN oxidoreductase RutF
MECLDHCCRRLTAGIDPFPLEPNSVNVSPAMADTSSTVARFTIGTIGAVTAKRGDKVAMRCHPGQSATSGGKHRSNVDRDVFRSVMASVCTPVSVVTALADDRPHGTTVSAFASLSLEPPMVLAALDRSSQLLSLVVDTGRFGVNILGGTQPELALNFARKGDEKFQGVRWHLEDELPRLQEAPGWLACDVDRVVDGGDHVIALGVVVAANHQPAPPLTYHQRLFGTHAAWIRSS